MLVKLEPLVITDKGIEPTSLNSGGQFPVLRSLKTQLPDALDVVTRKMERNIFGGAFVESNLEANPRRAKLAEARRRQLDVILPANLPKVKQASAASLYASSK